MPNPQTTPEDMTIAELQAEIGKLQQILFRKVAGDPIKGFSGDYAPWDRDIMNGDVL
jgi:hypothetical protein